ncbi:hypothetical protein V2J09_008258 [Rumex salicifolius]
MALLRFHVPTFLRQKPSNSPLTASLHLNNGVGARISTKVSPERASQTAVRVSLSENQPQASISASTLDGGGGGETTPSLPMLSASEVVRQFYDGINRRDLPAVEGLIAENCVYEDLIFPRPFVGRKNIMAFFEKFIHLSIDLQFAIDDISTEDSSAIGVKWHFEYKGTPFPFSKGCSFYRLEMINGTRQIVIIQAVTWLLQRFPQLVKWL